jgi:hypothetical protein
MKKKLALVLALLIVVASFSSCTNSDYNIFKVEVEVDDVALSETAVSDIQPENVEISIRKDLVDEVTFLTSISEFEGITVTSNDVYHILTMSQETYVTFLKSKAQEVYDMFDEIIAAGSFVEDITYNEDFRVVKVIVDREGFDAIGKDTQRLQLMTIGAYAMSYQIFLDEGQKTTVIAVCSDNQEEVMAITLPISM